MVVVAEEDFMAAVAAGIGNFRFVIFLAKSEI